MEYQKVINLLDDITNHSPEFRIRNWIEVNYESRRTYNESNQIKFKTSMIRSNFEDYNHACIHIKRTIKVANTGTAAAPNNRNKKLHLKIVFHLLIA